MNPIARVLRADKYNSIAAYLLSAGSLLCTLASHYHRDVFGDIGLSLGVLGVIRTGYYYLIRYRKHYLIRYCNGNNSKAA